MVLCGLGMQQCAMQNATIQKTTFSELGPYRNFSGRISKGVLRYIDYTGMCRCTGYGFQTFLSRTWYREHEILGEEQRVKFKRV